MRQAAISLAGTLSSGSGQSGGCAAPRGRASIAQRSTMRGSFFSPKRMSLRRMKRASPAKPDALAECRRETAPAPPSRCAAWSAPCRSLRCLSRRARAACCAKRQPAARQVGDDGLPDARHVVGQRRAQRWSPSRSTGRSGKRWRSTGTTEWQRTKSPIHIYGTIRIGRVSLAAARPSSARPGRRSTESLFIVDMNLYSFISVSAGGLAWLGCCV